MNKIQSSILISLLVLLFSSISYSQEQVKFDIYYFHATMRCESCIQIEELTKSAVQEHFASELTSGLISLTSIDFLQPENQNMQDKYQFDSQTLIVSKKINGTEVKWINLDKMWDYLSKPEKFKKYIVKEIKKFTKIKSKVKK